MKTLKIIIAITIVSLFSISCSNDDDEPAPEPKKPEVITPEPIKPEPIKYAEENPLDLYLAGTGFSEKAVEVKDSGNYEYGFSFKPTVNGKINALIVKIPDINPAVRITIWDATTKTVIKSELVNVPTANLTVEKAITPIVLVKDKEYYFTINSDDWISRKKTDGSAATYPIVAGNITITNYAYIESTTTETIFPTNIRNTYYAGDMTFKFQRTE
jgi:hypothetical protein